MPGDHLERADIGEDIIACGQSLAGTRATAIPKMNDQIFSLPKAGNF